MISVVRLEVIVTIIYFYFIKRVHIIPKMFKEAHNIERLQKKSLNKMSKQDTKTSSSFFVPSFLSDSAQCMPNLPKPWWPHFLKVTIKKKPQELQWGTIMTDYEKGKQYTKPPIIEKRANQLIYVQVQTRHGCAELFNCLILGSSHLVWFYF